ncbi:hypothetical protein M8J75_003861 [Diaphorina citri]|nr:hypothetical protein M8J75_003861 [Diaphorina citri]
MSWDSFFRNSAAGASSTTAYSPPPSLALPGKNHVPLSALGPYLGATGGLPAIGGQVTEKVIDDHLAVQGIIRSYQARGHLVAEVDPLGIKYGDLHKLSKKKEGQPHEIVVRQYTLEKAKIPPGIQSIFKTMHEETFVPVRTENKTSPKFQVCIVVKQGCVLAPALFLTYIHAITQITLDRCNAGVEIRFRNDLDMFSRRNLKAASKTEKRKIQELMFADDAALIAETLENLQQLLDTFVEVANQFGLKVNVEKTKCMFINCSTNNIHIEGAALETVDVFKYLGNNITPDGSCNKEINHRISAAARAFGSLYHRVWKSHDLSMKTKIRIHETVVLSTLLAIHAPLTLSNPNTTSPPRPCPSQATNGAAPIFRDPSGPRRDCPVTLGATSAEFKDEDTS